MKIKVLMDDRGQQHYRSEHGLSFDVDDGNDHILFDTGQSADFINNAKILNTDFSTIDKMILSHAHYDHCGGVTSVVHLLPPKTEVFVGEQFFLGKYSKEESEFDYDGIEFNLSFFEKFCKVQRMTKQQYKLNNTSYLFTKFNKTIKEDNLFYIKKEDQYIPDTFEDEIVLGVKLKNGFALIVGCSHAGIINIVQSVESNIQEKITHIIGGIHIHNLPNFEQERILDFLIRKKIQLGLCHCTGDWAIKYVKDNAPDLYLEVITGSEFIL